MLKIGHLGRLVPGHYSIQAIETWSAETIKIKNLYMFRYFLFIGVCANKKILKSTALIVRPPRSGALILAGVATPGVACCFLQAMTGSDQLGARSR